MGQGVSDNQVGARGPVMEYLQKLNEGAAHQVLQWTVLLNAVNLNISRLNKFCAYTHDVDKEKRNGKRGQYRVNAYWGMQEKVNCANKCKKPAAGAGFRRFFC
jgi:hypothetical protein